MYLLYLKLKFISNFLGILIFNYKKLAASNHIMAKYDFREGLEKEKIIYVNTNWDWRSFLSYIGYLLFTWGLVIAWFSLFQFPFIYHPVISVWVYGFCWLTFVIITAAIIVTNLINHYNEKRRRKREAQKVETVVEMQNLVTNIMGDRERINTVNNYHLVEVLDGVS
jgi:hypothetical protein